ncbi:MAG: hypothetical protein FVQ83_03420 [Chloroflexi bacterium]|nr:hypothetical protein [Chloroflexota bacterium]
MNSKQKTTIYVILIFLLGFLFAMLVMTSGADSDKTSQAAIRPTNSETAIPQTLSITNTPTPPSTPTLTLTPTNTASPTLTSTPTLEPTAMITFDTQCFSGPGPPYPLVGWLLNGTSVELIAVGQFGNWYIVNHPLVNGRACWIAVANISIVGINPENYPIWYPAPLPTSTTRPIINSNSPFPTEECHTPTPDASSNSWLLHPLCTQVPFLP